MIINMFPNMPHWAGSVIWRIMVSGNSFYYIIRQKGLSVDFITHFFNINYQTKDALRTWFKLFRIKYTQYLKVSEDMGINKTNTINKIREPHLNITNLIGFLCVILFVQVMSFLETINYLQGMYLIINILCRTCHTVGTLWH